MSQDCSEEDRSYGRWKTGRGGDAGIQCRERTLEQTVRELPDIVDIKILVDDSSNDKTASLSETLGVLTFVHDRNYGYGRNQQTCYREALSAGADIVVMVHPDYQYAPSLVSAMAGWSRAGSMTWFWARGFLEEGRLKAACRAISTSPTGC